MEVAGFLLEFDFGICCRTRTCDRNPDPYLCGEQGLEQLNPRCALEPRFAMLRLPFLVQGNLAVLAFDLIMNIHELCNFVFDLWPEECLNISVSW